MNNDNSTKCDYFVTQTQPRVTKFLRQRCYRNLVGKLNGTFTMAYAQWVSYSILADNFSATIKNASLSWGKFYKYDDKDNELSPDQVNGQVIESGAEGSNVVSSCGREDSSSGTQGQFDLYDGDTKVVTLVWDCPWGSKTNSWSQTGQNKNYIVSVTGGSSYGGAIGVLTAECFKKA